MTGSDCEKYRVSNVQRLMVPSIGKIPQLNRTNSPKCLRNGSFSGVHTSIPARRGEKCLCGRGVHLESSAVQSSFWFCTSLCPNVRTVLLGVVSPESPLLPFIFFKPPAPGVWWWLCKCPMCIFKGNLFLTVCSGEELENKQDRSSYAEEECLGSQSDFLNSSSFSASLMIFEAVLHVFCINKVGSIAFAWFWWWTGVCVWVYNYRHTHT